MKKKPVTTWLYPLFAHMAEEYGLVIVESEADDIIAAVEPCQKRRAESLATNTAKLACDDCGTLRQASMPTAKGQLRCWCNCTSTIGMMTSHWANLPRAKAVRKMAGKAKRPEGTCIHGLPFDGKPKCPHYIQLMHELTAGPAVNPRRG